MNPKDVARARIDNLIKSIRNYIGKGRVYTEQDLCRIYYKVKRNDSVWKPDDKHCCHPPPPFGGVVYPPVPLRGYPYRRDELVSMACDRMNPDDDDCNCKVDITKEEWKAYCKQPNYEMD